jgi:hypothetical protein
VHGAHLHVDGIVHHPDLFPNLEEDRPMILQLNPPIPVKTPKGSAMAQVLIDYGPEHDLIWVCFQDETGECWSWPNKDIRAHQNVTMGRVFA